VREREDANRTREAGCLDEIQGVVANRLNLFRQGAVGFIVWLDVPLPSARRNVRCCNDSSRLAYARSSPLALLAVNLRANLCISTRPIANLNVMAVSNHNSVYRQQRTVLLNEVLLNKFYRGANICVRDALPVAFNSGMRWWRRTLLGT